LEPAFIGTIVMSTIEWAAGTFLTILIIVLASWGSPIVVPLWASFLYSAFSYFIIVEPANLAYLDLRLMSSDNISILIIKYILNNARSPQQINSPS
jgi:hypothetical protein